MIRLQNMAVKKTVSLLISCYILQTVSGMAVDHSSQRNIISVLKNKVRDQWIRTHDDLVSFMSIEESKAPVLPSLLTLAGQLGLSTLVADIVTAGLTDALTVRGPLTVFGPIDAAFTIVPDWLKQAMKNTTILTKILEFHVLKDKVRFADITDELTAKTLQGAYIRFNVYPNNMVTAQCAPVNNVNVDKMASNGIMHELLQVMRPPEGNIVQMASACPAFKTLATAVETAGLAKVLGGEGPFTLFAPTESAFQKINPATLNALLSNKTALTDLLEYHVTRKTYCSTGLIDFSSLQMLNGEPVNITTDAETVKVNNAGIVPAGVDGSATNGVLHAIDTVLIPPSLQPHLSLDKYSEQSDQK